jgi:hypothetical protein
MKRQTMFVLTTLLTSGLAVVTLPEKALAQQGTLAQQLVGTWLFAGCDAATAARVPFCANPAGSLSYNPAGRYTLAILAGNRPEVKTGITPNGGINRASVSPEDYKAIGQGTVAQFGTWSVNETDKVLMQHAESTFFPGGNDSKYTVILNGNDLTLVGGPANGTFSWKRAGLSPAQGSLLIGTWKINREKSKGAVAQQQGDTLTYSQDGLNMRVNSTVVDSKGTVTPTVLMHIYDGLPHPSIGFAGVDSSAYLRADAYTYTFSRFKDGRLVQTGESKMSHGVMSHPEICVQHDATDAVIAAAQEVVI